MMNWSLDDPHPGRALCTARPWAGSLWREIDALAALLNLQALMVKH